MTRPLPFILAALLLAAGCDDLASNVNVETQQPPVTLELLPPQTVEPLEPIGDPIAPAPAPAASICTGGAEGQIYQGIGGVDLSAGRVENPLEVDRGRVKPYPVLAGEYQRALGKVPALYPQMATTFGAAPARWYEEPQASAIILYSAFRIAFQGCLDLTATPPAYATAPTAESAPLECNALSVKFWNRSPTDAERSRCAALAMDETSKETNPRRRWAYVCASLLTASGFLTY